MKASQSSDDLRASLVAEAFRVAAEKRDELARLRAAGFAAAGAEVLCNGALRHAIRLSVETSQARNGLKRRPISRRQMDKLIRILSRRRFSNGQ